MIQRQYTCPCGRIRPHPLSAWRAADDAARGHGRAEVDRAPYAQLAQLRRSGIR
jgi:hypothetical protein